MNDATVGMTSGDNKRMRECADARTASRIFLLLFT
jgi:hypothetical protein